MLITSNLPEIFFESSPNSFISAIINETGDLYWQARDKSCYGHSFEYQLTTEVQEPM